jgi:phosphatidylglycerol---prolipoprotein diacylglyceryl transferase
VYGLCVLIGILGSYWLSRVLSRNQQRATDTLSQARIRLVAIVCAGVGAHLAHLVPTVLGWLNQGPGADEGLFGRSVLGGLLAGWAGVEVSKWRLGVTTSVGPSLAAPLAFSLAWGRLGCWFAGCCGGIPSQSWAALVDAHGVRRWPVQPVEVAFHAVAFGWLFARAKRRRANGLDLVAYLASYGAVRFALEFVRWHPTLWLGLTWYQWLSVALVLPSAVLWSLRYQSSRLQIVARAQRDQG